jgi:hypothetical protein
MKVVGNLKIAEIKFCFLQKYNRIIYLHMFGHTYRKEA